MDLQKGKSHAHCQGIDACGYCQRQHCPRAEIAIQLFRSAKGFPDHIDADGGQQDKCDPVVKAGDEILKAAAEQVARKRHQRLEAAKI